MKGIKLGGKKDRKGSDRIRDLKALIKWRVLAKSSEKGGVGVWEWDACIVTLKVVQDVKEALRWSNTNHGPGSRK